MPIGTFILFLFTTAVVVFSHEAAAIAVASQGAKNEVGVHWQVCAAYG